MIGLQPAKRPTGARRDELWLRRSGAAWFLVAVVGQGAFVWMILAHYGRHALNGTASAWNDKPLIKGYVAGDDFGNLMFAVHVLLAAVITLGGLMQLVPALRQRLPVLHRWNGRLFVATAIVMALGGLWLTWGRGTYLSTISAVSVSINGLLILVCCAIAWLMAVRKNFEAHQRWAMRAFLVVNGVWFLRIGLMAWVLVTGGGIGMNKTLSGPADVFLQFGSYLVPLAVHEAYLWAKRRSDAPPRYLTAALVFLMAAVTAIGVVGAIQFMWGPYMTWVAAS